MTSATITFGDSATYDPPLEGWGQALVLVGQNVDAQYAFMGKFAAGAAVVGSGGAALAYATGVTSTSGLVSPYIALPRALPALSALGMKLFGQSEMREGVIVKGLLNSNNLVRLGQNWNQSAGPVFRLSIGSRASPLPAWVPGVVKGVLHFDLWNY